MKIKEVSDKTVSRRTWISTSVFALGSVFAYSGWRWLFYHAEEVQGVTAGLPAPAREVLNANEAVTRQAFSPKHLVKTYPDSMAAKKVRVNGDIGLDEMADFTGWQLEVTRANGKSLYISLEELKALPKTAITFDFKCIEGWDQISNWTGVRVSDFMRHYQLKEECGMAYLALVTPDETYYVGIDMPSALHPQTLLCYEMNGQPLPAGNGFPLRLIIPVKYGIKHLKCIGRMYFSNQRPPDYWAEQGYDYYAGL